MLVLHCFSGSLTMPEIKEARQWNLTLMSEIDAQAKNVKHTACPAIVLVNNEPIANADQEHRNWDSIRQYVKLQGLDDKVVDKLKKWLGEKIQKRASKSKAVPAASSDQPAPSLNLDGNADAAEEEKTASTENSLQMVTKFQALSYLFQGLGKHMGGGTRDGQGMITP